MRKIKNSMILYTLKRNYRSRSVRIMVRAGSVVVTSPYWVSKRRIEKFVEEKTDWIEEKMALIKSLPAPVKEKTSPVVSVARTKKLVKERLEHYNQFYNFEYKRIAIKNTKTKWGSCSSQKNLNFHAKLWHLPLELVDYVVVHELCHLAQMNHSQKFWALVAQQIPDFKMRRAELKKIRI